MRKQIQGKKFELSSLQLVNNDPKIFKSVRCEYILLDNNSFRILEKKELEKLSKKYGFQVEKWNKNSLKVQARLSVIEHQKLENYKKTHKLNNNSLALRHLLRTL